MPMLLAIDRQLGAFYQADGHFKSEVEPLVGAKAYTTNQIS